MTYNGYYGWQQVPEKVELMSPYEFVRYSREINPGISDSIYLAKGVKLEDYKTYRAPTSRTTFTKRARTRTTTFP